MHKAGRIGGLEDLRDVPRESSLELPGPEPEDSGLPWRHGQVCLL